MEFQLKIGILGAGAMGILYGGLLKRLGHDVNLIVRDYKKKKLLVDKGICLNLDLGRFTVYPEILHIKERCRFEVIIVFTKTNDTIEAMNAFKVNIDKYTYLMSLQNGLGNLEKLLVFADRSKIIYGTTMAPADLNGIREVSSFGSHLSQFKSGDSKNDSFVKQIAEQFELSGLHSKVNTNVDDVIWDKVAFNTAMNTICALLEITPKTIENSKYLKKFALNVAKETCTIGKAFGIKINKMNIVNNIKLSCKEHGEHKPSMLQDVLLKKKTEIDSLNGEVVRIGSKLKMSTPLNTSLFNLIKAKENNY